MRQGNGEAGPPPTGWLERQPLPQALEWWIEQVEARNPRREAAVLVARAGPLLDPRKVEEPFRQLVAHRPLAAVDLLPGSLSIGQVVAEPDLARADRVQDPASAAFDRRGDQRRTLLTSRATWTSAGFRSSRASTASTYGGR